MGKCPSYTEREVAPVFPLVCEMLSLASSPCLSPDTQGLVLHFQTLPFLGCVVGLSTSFPSPSPLAGFPRPCSALRPWYISLNLGAQVGRNCVHPAWEVEHGGDLLSLPPLNNFFSSLKHLLLSSLSPKGRWAGSQARPKLRGAVGQAGKGGTAPVLRTASLVFPSYFDVPLSQIMDGAGHATGRDSGEGKMGRSTP